MYGSYARDEVTSTSDLDVEKVDFVSLDSMNPIIKYYAEKDFIYV
ncbi:MAG: hypothetical protein ACNI28_11295 [Arcobacter sp.]